MKRNHWILLAVALVVSTSIYYYTREDSVGEIYVDVTRQSLVVSVSTTGELEAKSTVDIMGPEGMRKANIWETKINKIIAEGTVVAKGDFVAELDASNLEDRIKKEEEDYETRLTNLEQSKLDTALNLSEYRDKLINLSYAVEERKIRLEQSAFEPPATIKQAEMDVDKADRELKFANRNYEAKLLQAKRKVARDELYLKRDKRDLDFLIELRSKMIIYAPEDGMMIYIKERNGSKRKEGSTVQAWGPSVATLPDLSSMISRTYINEVDIRRIHVDQPVEIGLDAFPDKHYIGKVTHVANVGEQRPNSDAKVFEVTVLLNQADTIMRPSMTTSNTIITDRLDEVLCVPIEAINSQGDTLSFVYKKAGLSNVKQEILAGEMNDQYIQIVEGLEEGDKVVISEVKADENEKVILLKSKK